MPFIVQKTVPFTLQRNGTFSSDVSFSRLITLPDGIRSKDVDVFGQLAANVTLPNNGSASSSNVGYANSLTYALELPSDVTFTSESGVFLSEGSGNNPVPEPSAIILFGSGLAGLVGWQYRRKYSA